MCCITCTRGNDTGVFRYLFFGGRWLTDFGPLLTRKCCFRCTAIWYFCDFVWCYCDIGQVLSFQCRCAAISIIGADGNSDIFASKLAPDLLGAIAVAAYSCGVGANYSAANYDCLQQKKSVRLKWSSCDLWRVVKSCFPLNLYLNATVFTVGNAVGWHVLFR